MKSEVPYTVEGESEIFDLKRIQNLLAQGKWFRKTSNSGTLSLGGHTYYLPKAKPNIEVEIKFNRFKNTFIFFDANRKLINIRPAQGIAFDELVGDLTAFKLFVQENIAPPKTDEHDTTFLDFDDMT